MKNSSKEFYENWAKKEANNESREYILKWKAVNLANLYLRSIKSTKADSICEIGGGEGIVLNSIGNILNVTTLVNYELSTEFCQVGRKRFPNIEFINNEFSSSESNSYSLILLSDIIEHVVDDDKLMLDVSKHCSYALLKIPIEECLTSQEMFYKIRGRNKPSELVYGPGHHNGHLRGYTLYSARAIVSQYFSLVDQVISTVNYFYESKYSSFVNRWFGNSVNIWMFGGALFVLGKSNYHQTIQ